MVTMELGK